MILDHQAPLYAHSHEPRNHMNYHPKWSQLQTKRKRRRRSSAENGGRRCKRWRSRFASNPFIRRKEDKNNLRRGKGATSIVFSGNTAPTESLFLILLGQVFRTNINGNAGRASLQQTKPTKCDWEAGHWCCSNSWLEWRLDATLPIRFEWPPNWGGFIIKTQDHHFLLHSRVWRVLCLWRVFATNGILSAFIFLYRSRPNGGIAALPYNSP